jgi:hypothetical protein
MISMCDMVGGSMKSISSQQEQPSSDRLVESLQPQDVLMGRGACPSEHTGNETFRKFVEDGMGEYFGTKSNTRKNQIAHKIVKRIKANSGLFVKKLKERDLRALGLRTDGGRYLVVDDETAIAKAKQSFRYLCRTLKYNPQEKVEKEHEEVRASPLISLLSTPRARKEKGQASSLEISSSLGQTIAVTPKELMFLAHACCCILGDQDQEFD